MANHEIGSWGWAAERLRDVGAGLFLLGLSVALCSPLSINPRGSDPSKTPEAMLISGLVASAFGAGVHLLGKIGQEKENF